MVRPSLDKIFGKGTATAERPPLESIFKSPERPPLESIFKPTERLSLESIFKKDKLSVTEKAQPNLMEQLGYAFKKSPKTKPIVDYFKEAQPAFKWAISGMPKNDPVRFEKMSWVDVIKESYPMLKDPDSRISKSVMAQFGTEMAGELLEMGTKPSTYIMWGAMERLVPKVIQETFKKLPKSAQNFLLKERFAFGKTPVNKAYTELSKLSGKKLHTSSTMEEIQAAYYSSAFKWHPDKAPTGQAIRHTRNFIRSQGALDKIKASRAIQEGVKKTIKTPTITVSESDLFAPKALTKMPKKIPPELVPGGRTPLPQIFKASAVTKPTPIPVIPLKTPIKPSKVAKKPIVEPLKPEVMGKAPDLTKPLTPIQLEAKLPKLKNVSQIKREARKQAQKEAMLEVAETGKAKDVITEQIRQRKFNLNLATYETNLFVNELDRTLTKTQKETIPFLIEKTDIPEQLNRPDLQVIYAKDKENLQPIVEKVKQHFDEGWKKIQENTDDMTAQQIENYVTHIWDIPRSKKAEITNWFVTQNKFLKKRYISTLRDGIEKFGLKPKVLDISEIIRIHDIIANRVIENNKFVNWLSKIKTVDGTPLLAPSNLAPPDWVAIHHPALQKKMFVPGKEKLGEKISNELQDILTEMGVAIGRRISPVSFGKPAQVEGLYISKAPQLLSPEIRLQRFFASSTIAHEIGHHIDKTMNLGDTFLNKYKDELYRINKDRIKSLKGKTGKYGQDYAESTSEQIAEFFALLFTDAKKSMKLAPGATSEILEKLNNSEVLSKLVNFNFANRAKNLIGESAGTLINVPLKVHPDLANALRVIFDTPLRHPLITAYETVNSYLKKSSLTLSFFHPIALSEASIATMGITKTLGLLSPVKIYKALVKNELPVYTDNVIARKWIKRGLSLGATIDIPVSRIQKNLNDIAMKTGNIPLINKTTQFIATANESWDKLLWDYYQSSLKLYGAEHLSRYIDPTKDIVIQEREIAQLVNDTYGGQNWDVLMMGPKSVQLMTWGLLSADWTVSALIRQPMAFTGAGAIHKEGVKLRRKLGMMFWLKAALYFGAGINLLNALNRKKDYQQNPKYYEGQEPKTIWDYTMYGNVIGHKTHLFAGRYKDGTERYIRWGKQFRELPEMFFDDTEISPISASLRKIGGKTAPALQQVSAVMTGVSPSGYTQREIYGKRGWDRVWGSLKMLSKAPIPFSLRNSLQADKEFNITDLAMPSSKGLTPWKTVNYFKIGIEKYQKSGDDRIVKEVFQGAIKNNLNAYQLFKTAMTTLKAEKTRGINSLLRDIDDVNNAIKTERDEKVKIVLYRRKANLIKDRFIREKGIKLLNTALKELEYNR